MSDLQSRYVDLYATILHLRVNDLMKKDEESCSDQFVV